MPTYEYECPKCGVFEAEHSMSAKPLKAKPGCTDAKCPKKAERLISATSFQLKGGGWYKSDYGAGSSASSTSSKAKGGGGEKGSATTDVGSDSGKTEKKGKGSESGGSGGGSCGSGCGCH